MPPGKNSAKREKNADATGLTQDQNRGLWRELEAVGATGWLTLDIPFPLAHGYTDSGISPPSRSGVCELTVHLLIIYLPKPSFLNYEGKVTVSPASRATEGIKHEMPSILVGAW